MNRDVPRINNGFSAETKKKKSAKKNQWISDISKYTGFSQLLGDDFIAFSINIQCEHRACLMMCDKVLTTHIQGFPIKTFRLSNLQIELIWFILNDSVFAYKEKWWWKTALVGFTDLSSQKYFVVLGKRHPGTCITLLHIGNLHWVPEWQCHISPLPWGAGVGSVHPVKSLGI